MKRTLLALTAAIGLSACAEDYYGYDSYNGYGGYRPYYGSAAVYYDGYYGPYYNGRWGRDGYYYYSQGRGRGYVRDEHRHFRRDAADGYRPYHHHRGD